MTVDAIAFVESGQAALVKLDEPTIEAGSLLIQSEVSLISIGTEREASIQPRAFRTTRATAS